MEEVRKKKTSSVARRIRRSVREQLGWMLFCCNCIIFMLVAMTWCYITEREYAGESNVQALYGLVTRQVERVELPDGGWRLEYVIQTPQLPQKRVEVTEPLRLALVLLCAAWVIELLPLGCINLINFARIRHLLRPFDQIAEEAQRLSRVPLDTTRTPYGRTDGPFASRSGDANAFAQESFHTLEDAIEHIRPDAPGERLSTGQGELEGLEQAINNLILRMQATYQQQTRFVSDASHELRTPIAVIKGYTDMLARWGKDDEKVLSESIAAIQAETEHMNTLVEQLLFLARGDSGRTKMTFAPVVLDGMLSEVYEESRMIHPDHEWRYVPTAGITVTADAAMLKQAVRVLIDNAVKYTPAGETIRIRCYRNAHGDACIEVQDSGIGISEEEVAHMFERFFRSDPARSSQTSGTGLGLAIAKWIVDRHNGWFDVFSRPDIGTRITITLPVAAARGGLPPEVA